MRHSLADHQLEINLPGELPLVPTDYVLIEQVFMNLLSNSAKYAPSGTMINVTSYVDGDYLYTIVANQGPPVHEEDLARIFDKFYRVTAADKVTGTGLGLSICKGIIEAHEGRIWAQNQPGRFEFHFILPLTLHGSLPEAPREAFDG
jgi:two-component system sensor histidine kinase KdpD